MSSNILRRHRVAALLGAALIITPLVLSPVLRAGAAEAVQPTPVTGIMAPSGSFAPIVNADKPAVVTIMTKMKVDASASDDSGDGQQQPFSGNSPFDEYFRQFFGDQGMPQQQMRPHRPDSGGQQAEALGSGFIIASDGTIVTNNHVVDGATEIKVVLDDGTELPATLVGRDAKSDLAVVKVKFDKPLPTVKWGDSDKLSLGDQVLAIGNPFGIGTTVTAGIVSARGRDLHSGPYDDFIQVDAAINHGNSGGPLVAMDGSVVGINSAIYSPNGGSVGVGFAIPSDQAQSVVAKLIKSGSIEHGYIGVQIQPVTADVANAIGLDHPTGALIAHVSDDSPASAAGLKTGDIVTALGGRDIKDPKDLSRAVADVSPGTKEDLTVWRKGSSVNVPITVGQNGDEQKTASADSTPDQSSGRNSVPSLGLALTDITPQARQALNLSNGEQGALVARVNPDKAGAEQGIREGDLIVSVNQTPVKNAREASRAVAEAGKAGKKSVLLLVERGDTQTFIAVPFDHA
ncbi:DegQ family serine endoprotease [Mesorhizobium sp. DCY119]|uniref:DegQ family serine endoprotease n=1 Tax=Mesorhizobium sp. DCY119 TaxID=2108445 RepID=UPI000E6B9CE9|nr:DegQ family serine endoprotease [Mesorhizobium sp. DCY119]RJG46578.1 DegQ family serine endoprotease [Mesorhizobium sp. DCY119]